MRKLAWLTTRPSAGSRKERWEGRFLLVVFLLMTFVGWSWEKTVLRLSVRPMVGIVPLTVRVEGRAKGGEMLRVEGKIEGWGEPLLVMERDIPPDEVLFFSEVWLLDFPSVWTIRACLLPKGPCEEQRVIVSGQIDASSSLRMRL